MKKWLTSIFLLLAASAVARAQQKNMQDEKRNNPGSETSKMKTPEERAAQLTAVLGEKLKLSDEQKDKIYEISLGDARRFAELQKRSGKKSDNKPVFESSDAAIMDVLTKQQKEKYKKIDARKDAERSNNNEEKDLFNRRKETCLILQREKAKVILVRN